MVGLGQKRFGGGGGGGGGNCLKYLKRGGAEKRGGDTKILEERFKLGGGCLRLTNVIFSGTLWRDK